jgi:Zn-dependent protease
MTLKFRLGPIPVRIHAWFIVVVALLGLGAQRAPAQVAIWAGGFLATALMHELGHAIAARSFGLSAEVNLTLFRAGLGSRIGSLSAGRRVVVCLAGPAMSLLVAALAFAIARGVPSGTTGQAWSYLGFINLGWAVINLLPILPLDAGNAMVAVLDGPTKGRGEQPVRWLSIATVVVIGLLAVHYRMVFPAIICGFVAFQNARGLRTVEAGNREAIARVHLRAAFDDLERGDTTTAAGHCRAVLDASADPGARKDAVRLLAYAYATMESWAKLMELLESGGVMAFEDCELEKYERVARELGRSDDAQRIEHLRCRVA